MANSSRVGQRDDVHIGVVDGDVLCERAPPGEARLGLPLAHLKVATQAGRAPPAGAHERHGDPVADPAAPDGWADSADHTGEFVAGYVRQHDVGVVAHPAVPVASAQPGRGDVDDDPGRRADRVGHRHHLGQRAERCEQDGPHCAFLAVADRAHGPRDRGDDRVDGAIVVGGEDSLVGPLQDEPAH